MHANLLLALLLSAPPTPAEEVKPPADLARTIHSLLIPQVPREHEDRSEWGQTIPVPPDLRRPGLRRTLVKVGDRLEMPQGGWVRTKVWLDDPAKDIKIRVVEQKKIDARKSRLVLEVSVMAHGERQRQQWLRGLKLLDLTARADAVVVATFDVDLTVEVKPGKILPEVVFQPKVAKTNLELKEFDLQKVAVGVGRVKVDGVEARGLNEELKANLQELMKTFEPRVTEKVNEALKTALRKK